MFFMRANEKKEALYFFFWGLGVAGFGIILIDIAEVIRYFVFQKPVLWNRVLIGFLFGICLYLLGVKYTKKLG